MELKQKIIDKKKENARAPGHALLIKFADQGCGGGMEGYYKGK